MTGKALAGIVVGIAAVDVALIRNGHMTLSSLIRSNRLMRAGVVYMAAHLLFDLPYDPLHRAAEQLTPVAK